MNEINCQVCKAEIPNKDGMQLDRCARIERGDFGFNDDGEVEDNIKFSIYICSNCYLNDEDLCRFFNKLGLRVR